MQYEKFEEWMIGKRVREISSGDIGVITRMKEDTFTKDEKVYIMWKTGSQSGEELYLRMHQFEFVDELLESPADGMIIEMNGKRYRLVEIKG